jgi:hypothetical protein
MSDISEFLRDCALEVTLIYRYVGESIAGDADEDDNFPFDLDSHNRALSGLEELRDLLRAKAAEIESGEAS